MTARLCPICAKPAVDPIYAPFCCKRCQEVDLSRWLTGRYTIAGEPAPQEDEDGITAQLGNSDTIH